MEGNIRELRNVIERSLIVCEVDGWISATFLWKSRTLIYECSDDSTGRFELAAIGAQAYCACVGIYERE